MVWFWFGCNANKMQNAYLATFALIRHQSRVEKTKPAYHIVGVHCILSMSRIFTSICSQEPFIFREFFHQSHMHTKYRIPSAVCYSLCTMYCILLLICRHERCLIASMHFSDREYFNVCLYQSVVSFQTCYYYWAKSRKEGKRKCMSVHKVCGIWYKV